MVLIVPNAQQSRRTSTQGHELAGSAPFFDLQVAPREGIEPSTSKIITLGALPTELPRHGGVERTCTSFACLTMTTPVARVEGFEPPAFWLITPDALPTELHPRKDITDPYPATAMQSIHVSLLTDLALGRYQGPSERLHAENRVRALPQSQLRLLQENPQFLLDAIRLLYRGQRREFLVGVFHTHLLREQPALRSFREAGRF